MKKDIKENINRAMAAPKNAERIYLYITVVNQGQADAIINLMEYVGSSASFVHTGEGSAPTRLRNILNIEDNKKDIIFSFIKESSIFDAKKELSAFFVASKKNMGVAFAVPLSAIIGTRVYKFLTRTV